jgi:hypothetical protein
MTRAGLFAALGGFALLAGCAPRPEPRPIPAPAAPLPPAPVPVPPPPPAAQDWRDIPLTPGEWRYAAQASLVQARFGAEGAGFVIRCDLANRQLALVREGAGGAITIRTSFGARGFPAAGASLAASDPFLDALAFSRGRFTVEVAGLPDLVLPAWPEPARVVEDCRS